MSIKIYCILDNNEIPIYIGKTKNDLVTRRNQHRRKLNINVDIFEIDNVNHGEWRFWEDYYISLFKSWGFKLLNQNKGGGGPEFHTESSILKMRGRKHPNTSIKLKGIKRPDVSKRFTNVLKSEETKRKMSGGKKGHICYENPIRGIKISISNKKHYEKNSERNIKISNKIKGRKRTNPSPLRISINQYSKEGIFIKTWDSITSASNFLGKSSGSISECCRGSRKSSYGYIWKYLNK